MSFSDPAVVTYDAVAQNLNRGATINGSTNYYGISGTRKFNLSVRHTIPGRDKSGESHVIRLDVEHYDADAVYLYTTSAWLVTRTDGGAQVDEESEDAVEALVDFLSDANVTKLVSRQS